MFPEGFLEEDDADVAVNRLWNAAFDIVGEMNDEIVHLRKRLKVAKSKWRGLSGSLLERWQSDMQSVCCYPPGIVNAITHKETHFDEWSAVEDSKCPALRKDLWTGSRLAYRLGSHWYYVIYGGYQTASDTHILYFLAQRAYKKVYYGTKHVHTDAMNRDLRTLVKNGAKFSRDLCQQALKKPTSK